MGRVPAIGRRSGRARWLLLVGVALWVVACGGGGDSSAGPPYLVTREVMSHETTQDILVFAPDAEGSWPIVFALHGRNGTGEDLAETSRRLAERGFVVFALTYRTDVTSEQEAIDSARDLVCGGWYASSIAGDHGGNLDRPVTVLGWSLGAERALVGGLVDELDPTGELLPCSIEQARPDVIVAVAGCHYEFGDMQFDFDPSGWSNKDATIVMAVGEDDTTCESWQTEQASEELRSYGYDVDFVVFDDADHFSPMYLDYVDDELLLDADHPAGDQLVETVVDAVDAVDAETESS